MISFVGQLCTSNGLAQQRDLAGEVDPFTMPASSYLREQPVPIPVHFGHDLTWPVGEIAHLERSRADGLLVVGRLARDDLADLLDGAWFLSGGIRCAPTGSLSFGLGKIHEVSLTRSPAAIGTRPICWSHSDIGTDGGSQPHGMPLRWRDTWERAHQAIVGRKYRRADHLVIVDTDQLDRRAATAARPPSPAVRRSESHHPDEPAIRWYGEWIRGERAAELIDRYTDGYGFPAPA